MARRKKHDDRYPSQDEDDEGGEDRSDRNEGGPFIIHDRDGNLVIPPDLENYPPGWLDYLDSLDQDRGAKPSLDDVLGEET
jgi:hypothetical protein